MKGYETYKNSGVEWIGTVPSDWSIRKIKWLTSVKRGASPRPINDPKYFDENGEYAWVRIADVSACERYLESTTQILSELGSSLSVKMQPNDFFLSIAGTVGKPVITKIKCCIHDGFVWFPELKINAEYLYYIFKTGLPYQGLGKLGTQLNLNTDTVGDIFIPLPSNSEVEAVVSYLDYKTSQIDKLINDKQKLIELLNEERTAIINQAVTKGINSDVQMKDSGVEWLGRVPAHWNLTKIGSLSETITGFAFKSENFSFDNGIKLVRGDNVTEGALRWEDKTRYWLNVTPDLYKFYLQPYDILIGMDGSKVGKNYAMVKQEDLPLLLVQRVARIRANSLLISNYIMHSISSYNFRYYVNISKTDPAIPHITLKNIKDYPIVLPPTSEELKQTLNWLEEKLNKSSNAFKKIFQEINYLKEYKTALISEVVTGKVDVRNDLPVDLTELAL